MTPFEESGYTKDTKFTYSNRFGEVVLEPVTEFMAVSKISRAKVPEIEDTLFSMDTAEKIALITENRMIQIVMPFPIKNDNKAAYVIKHSTVARGVVCKAYIKRFETPDGLSAQDQIESMRS